MHTTDPSDRPDRWGTDAAGAALDPSWEDFARWMHELVDDACGWLATLRERPAWTRVPEEVKARLREPLPRKPAGFPATYRTFLEHVRPYPIGNVHPRFWGWVNGSGVPEAMAADFLASVMNCNVGSFDQSPAYVEDAVLGWLRTLLDYPQDPTQDIEPSGILTSGCSMANLLALAAARTDRLDFDVRAQGLTQSATRFTLYGSQETHSSVLKALELLGLGSEAFRRIPVDADFRVDTAALADAIAQDRAAGHRPIAVVGNAGTVNTGATDDLEQLADIAQHEELWFHIDGAFGALAWLCPERRDALRGMQRADSLTFDLHKWMYLPSDVGCLLVRDARSLKEAFSVTAPYLAPIQGGPSHLDYEPFKDRGMELTRRFRALKVWFALRSHGSERFADAIRANLHQARHLGERIEAHPELELGAPVALNVVTFRYVPQERNGLHEEALNELNERLLARLQEESAVPSYTRLDGKFVLRAAITNHRTRLADVDFLADETVRIGRSLGQDLPSTVLSP